MKNLQTKTDVIINYIFIVYTFILLLKSIKYSMIGLYTKNSWGVTEFLVNYQDGFVRRGLIGEILYKIYEISSISPIPIIIGISICSYIFVVIVFIKYFKTNNYYWWFLPLPIFLGNGVIIRKDYLIISLLIIILFIFKSKIKYNLKIIFITIISIFTLNIHEASFFIFMPMMLLIIINNNEGNRYIKIMSCLFILSSLIVISYFKGSEDTAIKIHNTWKEILPHYIGEYDSFNTIGSIGWKTLDAIKFHIKVNFLSKSVFTYGLFIRPITISIIYFFTLNYIILFNKNASKIETSNYRIFSLILLFQLASLSPMFLFLSCDYIRLVLYWLASSFLYFQFVKKETFIAIMPKVLIKFSDNISNFCKSNNKHIMYLCLLFITITPSGFNIESALSRNVFFTILSAISSLIDKLI